MPLSSYPIWLTGSPDQLARSVHFAVQEGIRQQHLHEGVSSSRWHGVDPGHREHHHRHSHGNRHGQTQAPYICTAAPCFCSVPALRSKEFFTQNDKRIFQTAKWNDEHAVITSVTIFGAGQNDLEMRQAKWSLLVLLIVFTDQMFQFKQVLRTV